ncbi:MAG: circadian clock KaiB family protein [Bacteroidota bacterium]|nr:circadian clock KaiB family protein [Bacteroidota bacterium]
MSKKIAEITKIKEAESAGGEKYILKLFVTGILPNSALAVVNIKAVCEKYLKGRYELDIIDIYQQPSLALSEDIIAVPVLIKKLPLPEERLIGDLSDVEKVLKGLDLI